jgi:C-terminal processing protease CtpA/Prc
VNDLSVEGNPSSIELLNDFNENRPLKVVVASRYAYEWSKLLRIRINEKDWPNIKKYSTRHVSHSNSASSNLNNSYKQTGSIYNQTSYTDPNSRNILLRNDTSMTSNTLNLTTDSQQQQYVRSPAAERSYYNEIPTTARTSNNNYVINKRNAMSSVNSIRSAHTDQISMLSTLSRSAVDITADGKVLRLCTLILDPNSPNPADSEFGFDLVTKVGGGQRTGDYYIDTVDDNSPASFSGLRSGDRLVEVDGIDVKNKTFDHVVQLINEAKLKCKLKLLIYPSVVINYGNPSVSNHHPSELNNYESFKEQQMIDKMQNSTTGRSMPDLSMQQQQLHAQPQDYINRHHYEFSKSLYKQKKSKQVVNEYDSIYLKNKTNSNLNNMNNLSKSHSNIYGTTNSSNSTFITDNLNSNNLLRPVPRLCTIYKNDQLHLASSQSSSNIGFGVQSKPASALIPNYLRISIVNYKSPAYKSGLEGNDLIVEVNGRNTLSMNHDETLHFIKSSYDVNNYVKLLVLSEFCFNWLKEHDLLGSLNSEDRSVFSYSDYLKNNHRYVPRLCKIKLFPFSKSFGFSLETLSIRTAPVISKSAECQSYAHIVIRVESDSPANTSSLQKGDRIIECDGINVESESEKQITDRIYQAFVSAKQISLFVVDPDTDNYFKSKCIKLHSMLPIVQHITNSTDI